MAARTCVSTVDGDTGQSRAICFVVSPRDPEHDLTGCVRSIRR